MSDPLVRSLLRRGLSLPVRPPR